jgi:L-threonylcarbamoyladenylate synthase
MVQTVLTRSPDDAAAYLRRGELVAFPTETVYGLGGDALQPQAVASIFEAKGRPQDNPLIVHLAEVGEIGRVARTVPDAARALLDAFSPGPLTVILPRHPDLPDRVTAGLDTVGVRVPAHPVAHAFLAACGTPVAAPSANRSGRPSPTTWEAVRDDLDGRIACILQGGHTDAGVESTVVDCTVAPPAVLRPGALDLEALREVVPRLQAPATSADPPDDGEAREAQGAGDGSGGGSGESANRPGPPRSPGTRHRHYAPEARVCVVDRASDAEPGPDAAYIGRTPPPDAEAFSRVQIVPDLETYAHDLFEYFRACDRAGCRVIYAESVPNRGVGRALNDRLRRAAER